MFLYTLVLCTSYIYGVYFLNIIAPFLNTSAHFSEVSV